MNLKDLIGVPYKARGRDKTGYDCYGLIIELSRRLGNQLPDVFYKNTNEKENAKTAEVLRYGLPVEKLSNLEDYCLLDIAYDGKTSTHIGMYIGDGQFIHATEKCGVCIENIAKYAKIIKGFYRIKQGQE